MTITISTSPTVIVLALIAALVGGALDWLGGKLHLPGWASLALALFGYTLVLFGLAILSTR